MNQFLLTANSRETSEEIMQAIFAFANHDEAEAERIWEAPTAEEMLSIWETVTGNGLRHSTEFVWGASGATWM